MPGLINSHAHLNWDGIHDLARQSMDDARPISAFKAAGNMLKSLRAGVTMVRDLGFHESGVEKGARIFWQNALFGGLARSEDRIPRVQAHVASGAVAQWREKLPRAVAEPYAERFGAALVALGYEDHPTRWLSRLRDAA